MSTNDENQAPQESQAGAESNPPAQPAAPAAPAAFGFGAAKGSGLSRGKRQAPPAAPVASSEKEETYIPTAIQIVEPERETFGGFGSKPEAHKTEPTKPVEPKPEAQQVIKTEAKVEIQEPAPVAARETPEEPVAEEAPAELKILPTEPRKVQEQRWDSSTDDESRRSDSRRDGSRRERFGDRREGRDGRDGRRSESRREDRRDGNREGSQPQRAHDSAPQSRPQESAPKAEAPAKSGGLLGWIKGLFTSKPEAPKADDGRGGHDGEHRRGGRRRRGRGRRGRSGDFQNRGPQQGGQGGGERRFEGGHSHGGHGGHEGHGGEGGGHRRRGRRGRGRGNRGDQRGGEEQGVRGGGSI